MKPKKNILKTLIFFTAITFKVYGQNQIQMDSIEIVNAFNKIEIVDTKTEIVDSLTLRKIRLRFCIFNL